MQQEFRLALSALDEILHLLEDSSMIQQVLSRKRNCFTLGESECLETRESICSSFLLASRIEILSRQGRIFLQIGAIQQASKAFGVAQSVIPDVLVTLNAASKNESLKNILMSIDVIRVAPMQLLMNEGLLLFAQKNYVTSLKKFQALIETHRKSMFASSLRDGNWLSVQDLVMPALNNMALSALYACQLKEAIFSMETLIRESPTLYLTDDLVFNICTLYELVADGAGRKKRVLQIIAKRFAIQDISPSSFRTG